MKPLVAKFRSFRVAEAATQVYYRRLSPAERLEILVQLREMARKETDALSGRTGASDSIAELKRS